MRLAHSGPPVLLLALGAAGLAGWWPLLPAVVLPAALLWTPGAVLARRFAGAEGGAACDGPGRFAFAAALSLSLLTAAVAPLYALRAPLAAVPLVLGSAFVALALAEFRRATRAPGRAARSCDGERHSCSETPGEVAEWAAFVAALVLLLPALLHYAGGNVDDWWDLAFVRSWIAAARFSFEEPFLGSGSSHPRFLWSAWLTLQAVVGAGRGDDLWRIQAGPLAAVVCVAVVSATAALARSLFGRGDARTIATIAVVPLWLWGSEEIPFFARVYQDKLVAALALAPVLLAVVVEAVRKPLHARSRCAAVAVAAVSVATVSVHSLVYTMAMFAALLVVAAIHGARTVVWLRSRAGLTLCAALGVPAVYPLAQALWLAATFGAEGISLGEVDNPVVRAHLALGRILGAGPGWDGRALEAVATVSPWWIVHPGAVFAPIAVLALPGLVLMWIKRRSPEARIVLVLSLVPLSLLFTPGVAALAGRVWVPWMLYRIGWLVPVAALIGVAIGEGWRARAPGPRAVFARAASLAVAALALMLACSTGTDRLRRGMAEHPGPASSAPRGNSLAVYRFLSRQAAGTGTVLAPPGLAELVPALAGKPVVAFTERGTLVFAADERRAYRRLRDRAQFYSAAATAAQRNCIASAHDARWAVLPRRLVATGSEERWIRRFGAESLLAARAADQRGGPWTSTREQVGAGLGRGWRVVLENRDWFVAEREARADEDADAQRTCERDGGVAPAVAERSGADAAQPAWLTVLEARQSTPPASVSNDVLASVTASPGARVAFEPPPQVLAPTPLPIWTGGPEPWEDVPSEVTMTLDVGASCMVEAVRVIPYAPRPRREAFEVTVDDRRLRVRAVHDEPLDLPLDASSARRRVSVRVRSLLGNPVSLRDVQLLGDSSSCDESWPLHAGPLLDVLEPDAGALQRLAFEHPRSGRPFLSLAHRASQAGRDAAAHALLAEATRREPSLVQAWIELGFSDDAAGRQRDGIEDFTGALRADSRSAWAHGCAAWAHYRNGQTLPALWHALRARGLDPYYADSWTLLAYLAHRVGLDALAERWLDAAQRVDRRRNWPVLARAEFAVADGQSARAREILVAHLVEAPFDLEARAKLRELDRHDSGAAVEQ